MQSEKRYAIAIDTSNECVAIGIGELDFASKSVVPICWMEREAHRASNTTLLPELDSLCEKNGIGRAQIACICVGRGPGSFTGVRIAMATAKGIAEALSLPLIGLSTQGSIAQGAQMSGVRGNLLVTSDAMRHEIYPSLFELDEHEAIRLSPDRVVKVDAFAKEEMPDDLSIIGDALGKYEDILAKKGNVLDKSLWTPTGKGLLRELEIAWRSGEASPDSATRHEPGNVFPIYTRLSDAEENERARLANPDGRDLHTGVQGEARRQSLHKDDLQARGTLCVEIKPFDAAHSEAASQLESQGFSSDAWSATQFSDDLGLAGRTWWMAVQGSELLGYAGAMLAGDDMQVLKVATREDRRRQGIASALLSRVAEDAMNLAASTMSLEVRESNAGARAFYEALGFSEDGIRPSYYGNGENAVIMSAKLPLHVPKANARACTDPGRSSFEAHEVSAHGESEMEDHAKGLRELRHPLVLAIESSCDETCASVADGQGRILSDIVSSQVDFHARFGGVVPEIASRKHIEAICGVCELALADAGATWHDLDAIGVTYAPGLVGALVVGVAFAKGAAWALDVPLVGANHLEGHLYANKLGPMGEGFEPPAVVSLLSGGNTMLVHMRDWQDYEVLGKTIDDAVGEAFDKVAKALRLPYPGGPHISELASSGDPHAIGFPRALLHSGDYRFSLSGLKTAVITYINDHEGDPTFNATDVCASFQAAVIEVQVEKARRALRETAAKVFCMGGGVAANASLRLAYEQMCAEEGAECHMPPLESCGDNAAMIALVALDRYEAGKFFDLDADAHANADVSEAY